MGGELLPKVAEGHYYTIAEVTIVNTLTQAACNQTLSAHVPLVLTQLTKYSANRAIVISVYVLQADSKKVGLPSMCFFTWIRFALAFTNAFPVFWHVHLLKKKQVRQLYTTEA